VGKNVLHYTIFNTPLIKSILRGVSLFFLRTLGWKEIGQLPKKAKYLIIVAPHTSNWDVFYGVILAFALKLDTRFLAKKELFMWPFSPLIKWLGGLPIDRALSNNIVDLMIHEFEANEKFVLAIAPEGTRHKVGYWKSGFYHIAEGAHVPIQLAFIDYASKSGGVGPLICPTGDIDRDMNAIRDFYLTVKGKHSDQTSPAAIRPQK
jgi:1-acyl-sn-glycerol-3-phosphate acyltransferase